MIRATRILAAGAYPAASVVDTVELDHEDRSRRRFAMTGARGTEFLVDLAEVPALVDGDGLLLDGGGIVAVAAKRERLVEFASADPDVVTRIAWHLGNRHTPTELRPGALRIRDDHVLVEMVKKLANAEIRFVSDAFAPEGGAYGHGHVTGHDHHDHGHDDHDHAAAPVAAVDPEMAAAIERRRLRMAARAEKEHVHGPDCGHDHHGHDHDQHGHAHGDHGHDHADHAHAAHGDHDHAGHAEAHAHAPGCACGHDHHHDHHDHDHHHGHKHG